MLPTFLFRASLLAICLQVLGFSQVSHTISNEFVRLTIDQQGLVTELVDRHSGDDKNLITSTPGAYWRLIFHRGRVLENVIDPRLQQYRFEQVSGQELKVSLDKLRHEGRDLNVQLEFTIQLHGDEIHWQVKIHNHDEITVAEVFYPELQGVDGLGKGSITDLVWPNGAGMRVRDLKRTLQPKVDMLTSIDVPVNSHADPLMELRYPFPASMAWFELTDDQRGIYFASHDPKFELGALRVTRLFQEGGALRYGFVKYPFVKQGGDWVSGDFVIAPHPGSWHVGAEKYRKWASTWNPPLEKPAWAQSMKGLFLVIMRQQYGNLMWKYSDIPLLYEEARKNGMDTVALFGWTEGGHDNGYPIYRPDPEMGGEQALRDNIAAVQRKGGHVILYVNGHIMDAETEFFRKHGDAVASRNMWGSPWFEQYNKASDSSFLRYFNKRLFAAADDGTPLWRQTMVERGQQLLSYGADGVIFDQLGAFFYPCFGASCSDSPSMAGPSGRLRLVRDLRAGLKSERPNAGFVTEVPVDLLAPHLDFFHGCCYGFQLGPNAFPEMLRFTFPELIYTTRQQAPRIDRKQANFALTYGFRFELEVRYQTDARTIRRGDYPQLREYLGKVSALRDRYWNLLGSGTYVDQVGLVNRNPSITARVFSDGSKRAVVAWNNTAKPQALQIEVPGKRLREAASVEGKLPAPPPILGEQELAVLIFE